VALEPARFPTQRPADARVLVVRRDGALEHRMRARWLDALQGGDLVVANDAATLPASLRAHHGKSGRAVELRLAAHVPRDDDGAPRFAAVAFGEGDWRTRTEDRAPPPELVPEDVLACGDVRIVVEAVLGHPRLLRVRFEDGAAALWSLLAHAGRPVQYAHLAVPLAPWDVATPIANRPVAFEAPSAGFALDWRTIGSMRERRIAFATLTHAAGLSSTGDPALDARLPLPEPYAIPPVTGAAIARTHAAGGRVVAVGTTVVRALEHAGRDRAVLAGRGLADQRIGAQTTLRVVDALLTGIHESGSSHYELLRAFASDDALAQASRAAAAAGYRTHEFGDSMLLFTAGTFRRQPRTRESRPSPMP
jgi:S-adenosylmethionine:tRNA ribosyltransferase-isomerase